MSIIVTKLDVYTAGLELVLILMQCQLSKNLRNAVVEAWMLFSIGVI